MYTLKDSEKIFVFTGPHGAGRKTVAHMMGSTLTMKQVLSYTTRLPKATEVNGQDYYFVSPSEFENLESNGEFLEVITIGQNRYGIRGADIERMFQSVGNVFLILNRYGAERLKQLYGEHVVRISIYAEKQLIEQRLRQSNDSEATIQRYLSTYDEEMAYRKKCEYMIENIDSAHTAYDLSKSLDAYLNRKLVDLD